MLLFKGYFLFYMIHFYLNIMFNLNKLLSCDGGLAQTLRANIHLIIQRLCPTQ